MNRPEHLTASELSGYLELGMVADAEELAMTYLTMEKPSAWTFNEAMDAVLVSAKPSEWRTSVENAYSKLAPDDQSAVRFKILSFYWILQDLVMAEKFLHALKACDSSELLIAMEVFLELRRIKEARIVARKCERALKGCRSEFDEGLLREALAIYYSHRRQPIHALNHWIAVPLHSPFLSNALVNVVQLSLWPALNAVERGLAIVAQKKREPDLSVEVQQPGLDQAITADIEQDLIQLKQKLEKIVSPARQRELGIDAQRVHHSGGSSHLETANNNRQV